MKGKKYWFHFRSRKVDDSRLRNSDLNSGKGNPEYYYMNNIGVISSFFGIRV